MSFAPAPNSSGVSRGCDQLSSGSLGPSPSVFGGERTFPPTGQKLPVCVSRWAPHPAGACCRVSAQTKHQCAPSPSCGHTGPKSRPATCAHLSCLSPGLCSCCVPCPERSVLTTCTALEAEGPMGKLFGKFREEMRGTGCGRGSGHGAPGGCVMALGLTLVLSTHTLPCPICAHPLPHLRLLTSPHSSQTRLK